MLTPVDEVLLHQAPLPFAACTTSDHRFYDRCWVAAYDPSGGTALNMGLGVYKNMNVVDGFVCCVHGTEQRNVRVSRPLRPSLDASSAGPLRYEVLEPFTHVRIELDAGTGPLGCRLDWHATHPPFVEARTTTELNGRTATDVQRYDQVGRVEGWIAFGDERIDVDGWFGARDHSWGVRGGVGGYEPETGPSSFSEGFAITWLLFSAGDVAGYAQLHRDGRGNAVFLDGVLRWAAGRPDRRVLGVEDEVEFPPGSRHYRRATLRLLDSEGETHTVTCERLCEPIVMHGAGYDGGFADGRGLGVHRGADLVEYDCYDLSVDGRPAIVPGGDPVRGMQREQPVAVVFDGQPGTGDLTVIRVGGEP